MHSMQEQTIGFEDHVKALTECLSTELLAIYTFGSTEFVRGSDSPRLLVVIQAIDRSVLDR